MTQARSTTHETTPVDDVRRIRERFDQEAGGNVHQLAEQSRAALKNLRRTLNLKLVPAPSAAAATSSTKKTRLAKSKKAVRTPRRNSIRP